MPSSSLLLALSLACSPPSDTAAVLPVPDDTGTPIEPGSSYFEPTDVGFEYTGGWDEYTGALTDWRYNGDAYNGYVSVMLVDKDYFFLSSDDPARLDSLCELRGLFQAEVAPLDPRSHETGAPVSPRTAFVGTLEIFGYDGNACYDFDPTRWTDGQPLAVFDGMRFGMGLGPLSDYLAAPWAEQVLEDYGDYMMSTYVAMNRPAADGGSGVELIAYDWSVAFLWQWDYLTHDILLDDDDLLVGQDVHDPYLSGWVNTYAYWFEPLETFALDRLQDEP